MDHFEFRWLNFRGFSDTEWLQVKPLTVVIGANNTGKTSLHLPLLLMKQSLEAEDPAAALVTVGELANAGGYRDLVTGHALSESIRFALRFLPKTDLPKDSSPPSSHPPGACQFTFRPNDSPGRSIGLQRYEVFDPHGRRYLTRNRLANGGYSLLHLDPPLPRERNDVLDAVRRDRPEHFLFTGARVLRAVFGAGSQAAGEEDPAQTFREFTESFPDPARLYLQVVTFVESAVEGLVENISYLGPLRDRPRRLYEVSGERPRDVGPRGQFAPEIVYRMEDRAPLLERLERWLRAFDFGQGLVFQEHDGAFSAHLRISNTLINLADVGFGVSQVLPLLVQGLSSQEGSTLIAEQPEIHLNPRLQARLADLFAEIAASGRSVIVETHSEHLLLRLRRLIADAALSPDDVALYYVERRRTRSNVRAVPIHPNGHIDPQEWPIGFFEESLTEALELAAAQQRNRDDR